MPLGLIWHQQLAQGGSIEKIQRSWPHMTVEEITHIIEIATRRYQAGANQRR